MAGRDATTVRITLKGPLFDKSRQRLINQLVDGALGDIGAFGERLVKDRTPIGASTAAVGLQGSIYHELRGTPTTRGVTVSHGKPYGEIVEVGRRPGRRPPLAPILTWVKGKVGLDGKAAVAFAIYVQRKIGRVGYAGAFMFRRSMPPLRRYVAKRVRQLQAKIARTLGGA